MPAKVTIRDYVTLIDGCPVFPISAYNVSSVQDAYDAGFNCIMGFFASYDIPIMDEAYDLGLPVIVGGMTGMLRSHLPEKAGSYAEHYMNHPATFAHYMVDEPDHDWYYVPPDEVKQAHESIHAVDPNHPTMLLQMKWSIRQGARYNYSQSSDIFACDPYVFAFGEDAAALRTTMYQIRLFDDNVGKPVWFAIEGGWDTNPELTREEQYATAWTSIASNVNGLFFFEYGYLKEHPDQLQAALDITAEIRHIEGALTSPISTLPQKTDGIVWYSRQSVGGLTVFAANTTDESKTGVTINHSGIAAEATVTDVFDERSITLSDGSITDDFAPYERHVYVINATPHFCLAGPGNGATDVNPGTKIKIMAIDDMDGINASTIAPKVTAVASHLG